MIGYEDSFTTFEYKDYFKILPQLNNWGIDKKRIKQGKKVKEGFVYSSDNNKDWMTKAYLRNWIKANKEFIGKSFNYDPLWSSRNYKRRYFRG
jgi:UDP-N-acetylglucosamine 4,6-dehydratase